MNFADVVARLKAFENPYPGLRPFDVAESHLFFGRDQQVAELVRRLERHRFVAVVGVSGSGKSSLVRAGLVPALERGGVQQAGQRWRRVVTRPAGAPFDSLSADLQSAGLDAGGLKDSSLGLSQVARRLPSDETLLVVVDQFEELFRYKELEPVGDERRRLRERQAAEAAEFVQLLLEASRHQPPVYVVITMRSDYLGDCAEFRDLPETLNECQYLVPRMTRQQRREAIEGPLREVTIAPQLVQRMLNDAGDEPDRLPVLQHALMRTWGQWRKSDPEQRRAIELDDYQTIGGIADALDRHAEQVLTEVPADLAECLFKRLTARGLSSRERREPATFDEIVAVCGDASPARRQAVAKVIDAFRRDDVTFLRPGVGELNGDTYIDITHESLIRLWKRLRDEWLVEEQLAAKTLVDVAERAGHWKSRKGELLDGLDFERVEAWDRLRNKAPAWPLHYIDAPTWEMVDEFIAASRRKARLRRTLKQSALLLIFGLVVGGLLYVQSMRSDDRLAQQTKAYDDVLAAQARQTQTYQRELNATAAPSASAVADPSSYPAPDVKPRAYIQVRSQAEAQQAQARLGAALAQAGFTVPKAEVLDTGPTASEVRYFRNSEQAGAARIARVAQAAGYGSVRVQYVSGFEDSKRIRANHYELWLAPGDVRRAVPASG